MFTKKEMTYITQLRGIVEEAVAQLGEMNTDARGRFDNRTDKWRESEKGEAAEAVLDAADNAHSSLEGALDDLTTIEQSEDA